MGNRFLAKLFFFSLLLIPVSLIAEKPAERIPASVFSNNLSQVHKGFGIIETRIITEANITQRIKPTESLATTTRWFILGLSGIILILIALVISLTIRLTYRKKAIAALNGSNDSFSSTPGSDANGLNCTLTNKGAITDDTSLKYVEHELKTERARLKGIIEGANVGTWEWNIETGENIINENWAGFLGYSLEEISPVTIKTWEKLIHPDDLKKSYDLINKHIKGESDFYECEVRMKHKDGHWVWILDRGRVITRDTDGKPLVMMGTHQSITKRKMAEKKLAESRMMLRKVIDTIPVRVFWKDLKGTYLGCNQLFAMDAGKPNPESVIGLNDYDMGWTDQADLYRADDFEVIKSGQPKINYEEPQTTPEGKTIWLKTSKIPLRNENNNIFGVLGTYEDITDKKKAEASLLQERKLLRTLIDNIPDAVYVKDLEGRKIIANKADLYNLGLEKEEDIIGKKDSDIWPPEISDPFEEDDQQVLNNGEAVINKEEKLIRPDGETIWLLTSKLPLMNNEGKIIGLLGVGRDITGIKKAEEELRQKKLLEEKITIAQESLRFKQNFLANMSHEIRTPLTGILGMVEVLAKTQLDVMQTDYLQTIQQSGENLREIVNTVLDFSKIEAGKVKLKRRVFAWENVSNHAESLFKSICKKPITFSYKDDHEIPSYIKADENRIAQIVSNLISNAVKFTDEGEITMRSELQEHHTEDKTVKIKISVSDTGIGIAQERLKQLFQPFTQIDDRDTRQFEGTGLGLSISKELVKLHRGEIGAESQEGVGSTFWFTFKAEVTEEKEIVSSKNLRPSAAKRSLRILLAEDKVVNQKVIKLLLSSLGHEIVIAENGEKAVAIYEDELFDLILMDIQMPVMDGIAATQQLRQNYHNLPPIVGLSANAFEGDREKYMAMGLDEYITKPFKVQDFQDVLEKLFG